MILINACAIDNMYQVVLCAICASTRTMPVISYLTLTCGHLKIGKQFAIFPNLFKKSFNKTKL